MKLWTVCKFEFSRFFKWQQELISLGLIVFIYGFMAVWGLLQQQDDEQRVRQLGWLSELQAPELDGVRWHPVQGNISELVQNYDLIVDLTPNSVQLYHQQSRDWQQDIARQVANWWQDHQLQAMDLPERALELVQNRPSLIWQRFNEQGEVQEDSLFSAEDLGFFALILVGIGAFTSFAYLLQSITSEKQQRVTEQLLTLIDAQTWISGKILGIGLLALKTMLTTSLILLAVFQAIFFYYDGQLLRLELSWVLLPMLLFILLGLYWVIALMAGLASLVNDPNHSSKSLLMLIPMLPLLLSFSLLNSLDGNLALYSSIVPITSYAVMPLRLAAGEASWGQALLALALLLPTLWAMRWLAGRIFQAGIRSYGRELGFSELMYQLTRKQS